MSKLYILLPVHNRKQITQRIITCLQQQTFQDYHLLLIDDGSTDGTAEMVKERISSLTILQGRGDWWWGGSLHQGYLWLKSQTVPASSMVLMINDDAVFDENYLQTAISILNGRQRILLVSNAYGEVSRRLFDGGVHADWKRLKFSLETNPGKINCASTRGLFLYISYFLNIGGFYPCLLPHYASDYEFTVRAYNKGYALVVDEHLILYANESATGIMNFKNENTYSDFLKHLFSKKYALHPVYYSNFILLACPWPWKIFHVLILWTSSLWKIVKYFFLLVLFKNRYSYDK
jgi:GT2 family glycosyltransferase